MHYVQSKGILSAQNGMNLYRGCSHGCIYCDSRSFCYGFSHPFEDIEIKENAPELLEKALRGKRKKCMLATGAMSDPYLHLEEKIGLTRRCLEIIERYEFGLAIQTKSAGILRDLDLIKKIHRNAKCVVQMTLTTYDEDLCRILEPRVSSTAERFEALKVFRDEGIPTIVWISPILPFINDSLDNLMGLLSYCKEAGVRGIIAFGMGLTLRAGNREYFYQALDRSFPGMKERYIETFGWDYVCSSPNESELMRALTGFCRENQILFGDGPCFAYMKDLPERYSQLSLSDLNLMTPEPYMKQKERQQ